MQKSTLYFLLKQRRTRRTQKKARTRGFFSYFVKGALAAVLIAGTALIFLGAWEFSRVTANLPSADDLPAFLDRTSGELLTPTRIYDRTGKILLAELGGSQVTRQFLALDPAVDAHFSPDLLTVVVQVIQPNFWQSSGVDLTKLTDPAPHTIAERLVQDLLLTGEPVSPIRALRMRLLAAQAVDHYGRQQVLEWYLNSVYLGHAAFGVEAASQLYLGKSARDLTLAESVLMTALMDAPALNPLDSPGAAVELQKALLAWLMQNGAVDSASLQKAALENLVFRTADPVIKDPYSAFTDKVAAQLEPVLGVNRLQRGGLTVVTTLDADLQSQLECTAQTQLSRIENSSVTVEASENSDCPASRLLPTQNFQSGQFDSLTARGVIVDPASGQVLAYLAPISRSGETSSDDLAQPGSLLSPVVALAGFARGESPASLLWDIPASLPAGLEGLSNPGDAYHGPVSFRSAIANDYLVPIAQLVDQFSPSVTWQMGFSLGLDSFLDAPSSPEPLFQDANVPLLELAQVYATLANSGTRVGVADPVTGQLDLNLVLRVETASHEILEDRSSLQSLSIVSDSLAYLINNVLGDAAARYPSLGYSNPLEIGQPSAAKIGQSASGSQVWTAGYTPGRLVLVGIENSNAQSGPVPLQPLMAAGLWNAMIRYSAANLPAGGWSRPADVTELKVCSPSGLLPTDACPAIVSEVFLAGNEPTYPDNLYRKVKINRETGLLATVFTPSELVDEKVTLDVPIEARAWALAAGLPLTPAGYDAIQAVSQDPQVSIASPKLFSPVQGKVEIRGTAADANFKSYSLQVGEGINPSSWIQIGVTGDKPVTDGVLAAWDTSGLDGLYAIRLTVVDRSNQVKTAVIQVTVDNNPPQVSILFPQPGSVVEPSNGIVTFNASVKDNIAVARVEWWLDGKAVQASTSSPYYYIWQSTSGNHKLILKAWDTAGNPSSSPEVAFTIAK